MRRLVRSWSPWHLRAALRQVRLGANAGPGYVWWVSDGTLSGKDR